MLCLAVRQNARVLVARFGGSASSAAGSVELRVRAIMAALGVAYVSEGERRASLEHFSFAADRNDAPLRIDEYQYALYLHPRQPGDSLEIERGTFVALVQGRNVLRVTTGGRTVLDIPIQPALERAARPQAGEEDTPEAIDRSWTEQPVTFGGGAPEVAPVHIYRKGAAS